MKALLFSFITLLFFLNISAQPYNNQNGLQTSVINGLSANATQARRYEIASIGYNSYHWQAGGVVIVELFGVSFQPGYDKYIIQVGYQLGTNTTPFSNSLVESQGTMHTARVVLGQPSDLSTYSGGFVNRSVPVYVDVRYYATYQVKVTYLHNLVNSLDSQNQIKINTSPSGVDIDDFTPVLASNSIAGNLHVTGSGDHYIQNGKLGIGTTHPETTLHVNGQATMNMVTLAEGATHIGYFGRGGSITSGWSANPNILAINYHSRDFAIGGWSKTNPTWMGAALYINSDNNFVGIGTNTPAEQLSVNGKIRAKEIKVETANWPDYVFAPSFKLLDLKATEQFINENKHLPEIPSAAEAEKEGISLGEMNSKLLKKIEELTLHLIEQNKRLDAQQEIITKQQSQINSLLEKNN